MSKYLSIKASLYLLLLFNISQAAGNFTSFNGTNPCETFSNSFPISEDRYICQGESTVLSASANNNGILYWYDSAIGGNLMNTGNSITKSPVSTQSYWVEELDSLGCISQRKEVIVHVSNYLTAPTATDAVICKGATANLTVAGSGSAETEMRWYDAASGGNLLHTGNNFNIVSDTDSTLWVEEYGGEQIGISPHNSVYSGNSRGYWFTAPCDFVINGIRVPADASNGDQSVEVVRFTAAAPPLFGPGMVYSPMTSLFRSTNISGNNIIACNINVTKGDKIGVLGVRSSNAVNSYGLNSFHSTIYGNSITLKRLGMQNNLMNTAAQNLFTENSSSIGRVELYYGNCSSNRTAVSVNVSEPEYAEKDSVTIADNYCVVNENGTDWHHYYNSNDPAKVLFSIAHDPDNLGNNSFDTTVEITVSNNPSDSTDFTDGIVRAEDIANQEATFAMGRYWNVETTGTISDPVSIRFYYEPSEMTAILNAAATWKNNHNNAPASLNTGDIEWFKTLGSTYSPATVLSAQGLTGTEDLTAASADGLSTVKGINYVQLNGITGFSGGTAAVRVSGNLILDVELTDFNVRKQENISILEWYTENGEDLNHFEIERSKDGIIYEKAGDIKATEYTNNNNSYLFTDNYPFDGLNYYRLLIVEKDGTGTYSETRVLEFKQDVSSLNIYPNPFDSEISIDADCEEEEKGSIKILNMIGQVVYQKVLKLNTGKNREKIKVTNLSPGTYLLCLKTEFSSIFRKIVKK